MPPTPLLIVTGPPASGKTTLARRLANDLHLPLLNRDDFKEKLFDNLGWADRQRSKELGAASYALLWQMLESNLAAGVTTIVESNFRGELAIADFQKLLATHPFVAHQINCYADGAALLQRYRERSHSGARHPGHVDDRNEEEFRAELMRGRFNPLPLDGELYEIDTTDFVAIDYDSLLARLRKAIFWQRAAVSSIGFPPHLDALDHLVLTVHDIDATRDWYSRNLGMGAITFPGGRTALTFGQQKINLHQVGHEFEPKAARPTPGSADLCFLTTLPIAALVGHLTALGTPIEVPPSRRDGARGPILSIYLRDPDHNLIEVSNQLAVNDPTNDYQQKEATVRYKAVVFDLLSGLLDSWTLWNTVAGSAEVGMRWRQAYLRHTYATHSYRPYETLVAEAALQADLPASLATDLIARWDELMPWPEVAEVLGTLAEQQVPLAAVTNCSNALGARAIARVGVPFSVVVTAERAGFYKPDPRPYRLVLEELGLAPADALFLAGSPFDVPGATGVGLPTVWHNRLGMTLPPDSPQPLAIYDTLRPLVGEVLGDAR